MNNVSLKEKAVLAIVGMALLYALAAFLWFTRQSDAWAKSKNAYFKARETYAAECDLIARKQYWNGRYASEKAQMPTFETGRTTETRWFRLLGDLAEKHNIKAPNRKAQEKVESQDDVFEKKIDITRCEGSFESLVRFIHELENTDQGMFDVSYLNIKPNAKTGYHTATFTVTCAYMEE